MQSMLSIMPGNPLASLIDNSRLVSPKLGALNYSSLNIAFTARQNWYIESRQVLSLIRSTRQLRTTPGGVPKQLGRAT
jgi:hypothetical protein